MVQLEVWGPYACFTRPELKSERMSYDVMTPSAARGILEALLWHPGLQWHVDRIYVMSPVKWTSIRRNEVKDKISLSNVRPVAEDRSNKPLYLVTSDSITQRAALVLQDVHYVIEAHFEMTPKASAEDSPEKFINMFNRRARKGQCWHMPYFGCREFPVSFRLWEDGPVPTIDETRDLGLMFYDFDYTDMTRVEPTFFRAEMESGVVQVAGKGVLR